MRFFPTSAVKVGLLLAVMVAPTWAEESSVQRMGKAAQSDVAAMYQEGVAILMDKSANRGDKALEYLETVVFQGAPELSRKAKIWLGRAYRDGLSGTHKNVKKAFSYFEQAAGKEGKDPEAQYELGKAYLNGMGTDRNLIAAYMWTALSLRQTSDVESQARQQEQLLSGMLNAIQLEKAKELVSQLETLYLN